MSSRASSNGGASRSHRGRALPRSGGGAGPSSRPSSSNRGTVYPNTEHSVETGPVSTRSGIDFGVRDDPSKRVPSSRSRTSSREPSRSRSQAVTKGTVKYDTLSPEDQETVTNLYYSYTHLVTNPGSIAQAIALRVGTDDQKAPKLEEINLLEPDAEDMAEALKSGAGTICENAPQFKDSHPAASKNFLHIWEPISKETVDHIAQTPASMLRYTLFLCLLVLEEISEWKARPEIVVPQVHAGDTEGSSTLFTPASTVIAPRR